MARIPFVNVGEVGIIKDVDPHNLPSNVWSDGRNMRFVNGRAEKALGYQPVFTPQVNAQFALPVESPAGYFWLYAGENEAYAYKDGTNNIATRASGLYNGLSGNVWTGGVLNGIAILNNFNDVPQAWTSPGAGNRLVNLPNWNLTWRARSIRPFLNYLVALGVKKGANDNPWLVAWSDVTDPGTVPSTWDGSDPQNDAGDMILADTNGYLVDQATLGSANIIYKTDSAYAMRHVGGIDIMGFTKILKSDGLLMPNGVVDFSWRGDRHVVFGPNEIYTHDGRVSEPILQGKMRDWLYRVVDQDTIGNSFLVHNKKLREIWVCFPEAGEALPNLAVVWNYRDNTSMIKELPPTGFIATGKVLSVQGGDVADTWENADGTWESDTDAWGFSAQTEKYESLLMFTHGSGKKAYLQDTSMLYDTAVYESYVERVGMAALGKDPISGKPIYDTDQKKIVLEVWPRIKAEKGAEILISLGTQDNEDDPIKWHGPFKYIAGTTDKVNPYVNGKILSIRFAAKAGVYWQLSGYDLEVVPGGRY